MDPSQRGKADAWERAVERAFRPGTFIPDRACSSFVSDLEELAGEVNEHLAGNPERAVAQHELLLAGCYEKTDELDDSSGSMGMFVDDLFCGWVRARQALKADPEATAHWLLTRMDDDPHGYCQHLEREVAKVLGYRELAAFIRGIEARAGAGEDGRLKEPQSSPRRWADALRTVYLADGRLDAYVALAESVGLSARDCETIAEHLMARDEIAEALGWVDRGLGLGADTYHACGLARLRRALLVKLGRGEEALQSAWADFTRSPSRFSYEHLAPLIPEAEGPAWRERVLGVVEGVRLEDRVQMLLMLEERNRLAHLVDQTPDPGLAGLSHTLGEPAAAFLEREHPGPAARLWRGQALRILEAKRSKYYDTAVMDLGKARDCFQQSGQGDAWDQTVAMVRAEHRRKLGFMADFERLVAGVTPGPKPTFLERAKIQWEKGRPQGTGR